MKKIVFVFGLILTQISFGQSNSCAGATTLTIGAALTCGQTTNGADVQAGECFTNYGGGSTEETVWYRIDATNDSLVLNFIKTNSTNCVSPHIRVFGPFADGAGCLPSCATEVYNALQNGDPGSHILLTGLSTVTGNNDYLIQISGNSCGGPNDGFTNFCVGVANPATNSGSSGATLIDECGTAFNSSTNGGYFQNGASVGFNDLDNNAGTTCGGCTAGDDTPFIINNVSWTTFCSLTAGTWQLTVNGISGCTLPSPNQGVQASVFTGTTSALVNQGNSQNPIVPGGTWTSPTITVNAGTCAYLMIDGFAGDACNYSVTLTNITGGCVILPIDLIGFYLYRDGSNIRLIWEVASELNNDYFVLERSYDGINFEEVTRLKSVGDHSNAVSYDFVDVNVRSNNIYYKLSQVEKNGTKKIMALKYIKGNSTDHLNKMLLYPNPSKNDFRIEFEHNMATSFAYYEIYNLSSGLYYKTDIVVENGFNAFQISTKDLPEGNYVIRLITPANVFVEKFVKANY